ncbi:glycosyltransferase family 4 protein [Clostridium aminobutyricum]|uniref:Glycosyltransferase family 4 protein n=1 Tax=Clostridium aminobutyricum TaxID=33953 RepID=A0A939DAI8_CLOAM|nr:glycosyltransferase family 1 protein [Clostridium aminobutyricum]MBN7774052.1 glycosyltransferase family 4 protein [Clostridium aminobutyricum]
MKIVINATQFKQNSSGIGVLSYYLFGNLILQTELEVLVLLSKDSPDFPFDNGKTKIIRLPYDKRQNIKRNVFQSFIMGEKYCKDSIFITTDAKIPLILPKSCKVLPVITDLAVFRMGKVYKTTRELYWKLQYLFLKKKAERYVAISEFTKEEMVSILSIPADIIDVVYCACDEGMKKEADVDILCDAREKYHLPDRYVLFVGNFNPRKNLERSILAFNQMKAQAKEDNIAEIEQLKFLIVGEYGWKFNKEEALGVVKYTKDIVFTDYIDSADMPAIYSMADLFLFPTLYEGFGIPIVEAQKCGTPVITSNVSAMPEVAGEGAILVDPHNIDEMADVMRKLLYTKSGADLIGKGFENAGRFNWKYSGMKLNQSIKNL